MTSAASNVVRLSTAARRKPDNHRYAAQRQSRQALRAETARYFDYQSPGDREAMKLAQEIRSVDQTPALIVASAILRCLDDETYQKVLAQLAPAVSAEDGPARQALATARASRLSLGQQLDLYKAFSRLHQEDR